MRKSLLHFAALLLAVNASAASRLDSLAQRLRLFGERIPQEKVYVHMDNTGYFLGDTIWFAAYTRRTNSDRPSKISRVLYAELWNHDGYLVERKLVEMIDGRGRGFFALPDTLYSGYFELRAYTRWQLNWGQTEHFHPWTRENYFYNRAMAQDFYRDYEKLYSRVFPVYDKPKVEGDFYKDMTFRPLRRYFSSAPPPPELRLSLFPEGGNLVAGVPCRMAFEAATSEGEVREGTLSLQIKNEKIKIKNELGKEVDFVRTENRGRGTFTFTPEDGQNYEVVFTADDEGTKKNYDKKEKQTPKQVKQTIKDVQPNGVSLQVNHTSEGIVADIRVCGVTVQQTLGVTVMHQGVLEHFQPLESSETQLQLPDSILAAGVNQLTVFDDQGHVYADRLFFVTKPELMKPTLAINGIKDQYEPFEEVRLEIQSESIGARDSLAPPAVISMAVRDAVHTDITFDTGNIMTEMLLASEIKGFVPQPEWFFESDDEEHRRGLDLLMMTQGWRRFNWQEMAVKDAFELTHPAEYTQMVTGTVHHLFLTDMKDLDRDLTIKDLEEHNKLLDQYEIGYNKEGRHKGVSYNLNPVYDHRRSLGAITGTEAGIMDNRNWQWNDNDYNVLGQIYRKYDDDKRKRIFEGQRRFIERGNLKKEVRVHAEFVKAYNQKASLVGEVETEKGRFKIDLPRFYGDCLFYIDASDTTKWKKKWEGWTRRKKRQWIQMQDWEFARFPKDPEFYVRLNFPYPRFIKPYTYYQVHNAPMRDTTFLSPSLLTDGTHLMEQVTVRARHGGKRHLDFTKPAYVIDAYEATNMAMDAGFLTRFTSWQYDEDETSNIAFATVSALIANMGMERTYDYSLFYDSIKIYGLYTGRESFFNTTYPPPGDKRRWHRLEYIDRINIYTDYSPRREGDVRYEQSNQPSVEVMLIPNPSWGRRVTYLNRRYVLPGFALLEDFYHPDYHRNPPKEGQKDYRRTLYWNPDLQLDADGRAEISFFNNSQKTSIKVEAEGMTKEGELLYNN